MWFFIESANAHSRGNHSPSSLWLNWSFDPYIILTLLFLSLLYYLGCRAILKSGISKKKVKKAMYFYYTGIFILFLSLISPIDPLSDLLGWVHMLQHILILMVAAPLMVMGSPSFVGHWSFPKRWWKEKKWFRSFFKWALSYSRFKKPFWAWFVYIFIFWIWHLPVFYEAALKSEVIHDFQHISFFLAAYFFWRLLFDPFRQHIQAPLVIFLYPFVASINGILLGSFMALSPVVWYKPYVKTAPLLGYSALHDQQLAGLIMWMPAGITYVLACLFLTYRYLNQSYSIE